MTTASQTPCDVVVLLATHNGMRWLPTQLSSILDQRDVSVRIVVSDDSSSDGTAAFLKTMSDSDERITVLPAAGPFGSAAANFYRLLLDAETGDALVAFADQDDVWQLDKLATQAAALTSARVAGVSSDVTAFSATGTQKLIRKSFAERQFDYVCESAGPGCTYLLSPGLVRTTRALLSQRGGLASSVEFHDWLVYAIARASGGGWLIERRSTVDYRQHDANSFGANTGLRSAVSRFALIGRRWHRGEALKIARVVRELVNPSSIESFDRVIDNLANESFPSRLALARQAGELRRRPRDQWIIGWLITLGIW